MLDGEDDGELLLGMAPDFFNLVSEFQVQLDNEDDEVSALLMAANCRRWEEVQRLIRRGADVNEADRRGSVPLMRAARWGKLDIVKELLAAGAIVNAQTDEGSSSLHFAAENGSWEVLRRLLDKGADPTLVPTSGQLQGKTAAAIARDAGNARLADVLARQEEEWQRPFLLQLTGTATNTGLQLRCHTLGGNCAAAFLWTDTEPLAELPATVLREVQLSGACGGSPLRLSNLRLLTRAGAFLDVSAYAAPLAEQLQVAIEPLEAE